MRKALLTAGAVTALGITTITGAGIANAATDTTSSGVGANSLVTKLAEKFKLNKTEVQAVFDEQRSARVAEREQAMKDRLATAVKDGTITQAQSDTITAKLAELKAAREANRDKPAQERRAAMKIERDNLKQWAEDNDIDLSFLRPVGAHGHHGGLGRGDS